MSELSLSATSAAGSARVVKGGKTTTKTAAVVKVTVSTSQKFDDVEIQTVEHVLDNSG